MLGLGDMIVSFIGAVILGDIQLNLKSLPICGLIEFKFRNQSPQYAIGGTSLAAVVATNNIFGL